MRRSNLGLVPKLCISVFTNIMGTAEVVVSLCKSGVRKSLNGNLKISGSRSSVI